MMSFGFGELKKQAWCFLSQESLFLSLGFQLGELCWRPMNDWCLKDVMDAWVLGLESQSSFHEAFSLKNMEPLSLGFDFVALLSKWWERYVFIVPKWNYVILEEIEKLWAFSWYTRQCSSSRFECSETWPNDIETFCIIYWWKGMDI